MVAQVLVSAAVVYFGGWDGKAGREGGREGGGAGLVFVLVCLFSAFVFQVLLLCAAHPHTPLPPSLPSSLLSSRGWVRPSKSSPCSNTSIPLMAYPNLSHTPLPPSLPPFLQQGLGKTVQIVTMLEHIYSVDGLPGPFLVVVPLSTIEHWRREFEGWVSKGREGGREGGKG